MSSRLVGAIIALTAAALLAASIVTSAWWAGHPTVEGRTMTAKDVNVGLYRAIGCNTGGEGVCQQLELPGAFTATGYAELGASALLVLTLVLVAILSQTLSAKRKPVAWVAIVLAGLCTVIALVLIVQGPKVKTAQHVTLPIGYGMILFFVGIVCAIASSVLALRPAGALRPRPSRQPFAPGLAPPPPAAMPYAPQPAAMPYVPPLQAAPPPPQPQPVPAAPHPQPPVDVRAAFPAAPQPQPAVDVRAAFPPPQPQPPTVAAQPPPVAALPPSPGGSLPGPAGPLGFAGGGYAPNTSLPPPRLAPATTPPVPSRTKSASVPPAPPLAPAKPATVPPPVRGKTSSVSPPSKPRLTPPPPKPGEVAPPTPKLPPAAKPRVIEPPNTDTMDAAMTVEHRPGDEETNENLQTLAVERVRPSESELATQARPKIDEHELLEAVARESANELETIAREKISARALAVGDSTSEHAAAEATGGGLPVSTAPSTLPPPDDAPMASAGPSPACPQCEAPMGWVEEHLRFFCKSCRMYF